MFADVSSWVAGIENPFLRDLAAFGWRALVVLATLLVTWLVVRFLLRPVQARLEARSDDPAVASFLVNTLQVVVLLVALLMVLSQVGVTTTSLLAVLGAAGLAIALSLKDSLANFAAGLLILSFHSIRAGDEIEVGGLRGRVLAIHSFHTLLNTPHNHRVVVPNTMIVNSPLTNYSTNDSRDVVWTLPIPAEADLDEVKEAVLEVLRADERVLHEPPPRVYPSEWSQARWTLEAAARVPTTLADEVHRDLLQSLGESVAEVLSEPEA